MDQPLLQQRKIIYIGLAIIAAVVMYTVAMKHQRVKQFEAKIRFGGEVEFVKPGLLSAEEEKFARFVSKSISHIADTQTVIPLEEGKFTTKLRCIGDRYPLIGQPDLDRGTFKVTMTADNKRRHYGIAVNQAFLNKIPLKIGQEYMVNDTRYQLRGIIKNLPDWPEAATMDEPLMLMRCDGATSATLYKNNPANVFRTRIMLKQGSAKEVQENFTKRFPRSKVVVRRWDQ